MTTEQSAQALECLHCAGSGERQYMTQHLGPNDYEVTALCHDCNGSGEFKEPSTQAEWDRVYALVRHWSGRAERAEAWNRRHQPAAAQLAGWISVEDERKPELGQVILMWVYAANEGEDDEGRPFSHDVSQVQMGEYRDMGHGPFFDCFATPFADHEGVTHWMPLPPPPTQPKEPSNG